MAVMRWRVVARRGRESAFRTCVSRVRRAVLPTLSTDWITAVRVRQFSGRLGRRRGVEPRTCSRSVSDVVPKGSAEEKARWLMLISGRMRCLDRTSADILGPRENVSQRHRNESPLSVKARSCLMSYQPLRLLESLPECIRSSWT